MFLSAEDIAGPSKLTRMYGWPGFQPPADLAGARERGLDPKGDPAKSNRFPAPAFNDKVEGSGQAVNSVSREDECRFFFGPLLCSAVFILIISWFLILTRSHVALRRWVRGKEGGGEYAHVTPGRVRNGERYQVQVRTFIGGSGLVEQCFCFIARRHRSRRRGANVPLCDDLDGTPVEL